MTFEALFVDPRGRTPRAQFLPALLTLLAVVLFYAFLVRGRTGQWCLLVLLYPAFVLHARRLHDMGRSAWVLAVPLLLLLAGFAARLRIHSFGPQADSIIWMAALATSAAVALWGATAAGRAGENRFGAPA
jgi:uncharacterized membrane protein YhaH (DUF805 family)